MSPISAISPIFPSRTRGPSPCAVFLSGGGSNAERLLAAETQAGGRCPYHIAVLVTDRPEESRARELGQQYGVPVVANDIRAYYRERGLHRVSLATEAGRAARAAWTAELLDALAAYDLAFGVFAGFVPMTNLTATLPCLNVHPGDLTVLVDGRRHLVGLHTIPIERAMLLGLNSLRSSVILATPYDGGSDDMDTGPILGLSPDVTIDWQALSPEAVRILAADRPANRPAKGFGDALEALARLNQERLKEYGDWQVLPPVVEDVAAGCFGLDAQMRLYRRESTSGPWAAVRTVEYGADGRRTPVPTSAPTS